MNLIIEFRRSFDALVQRYEPPEGRNRWDAPLFELTPDAELPLEQIADYLANKRPPPPNKSTVNVSPQINSFDENIDDQILASHIRHQFLTRCRPCYSRCD